MSDTKRAPIEIWLRQDGKRVICSIVNPDESTYSHPIDSRSMLGSQKEITGFLIANRLTPDGAWVVEATDEHGAPAETWRRFTPPA